MVLVRGESDFIDSVFAAVRTCDLAAFNSLLRSNCEPHAAHHPKLIALLNKTLPSTGNTVLHELLGEVDGLSINSTRWQKARSKVVLFFLRGERRDVRAQMLNQLLRYKGVAEKLNQPNHEGNTPFHLAVKYDFNAQITTLIKAGARIALVNHQNQTALDLAAELKNPEIFNQLYKTHNAACSKGDLINSYTIDQLDAATQVHNHKRRARSWWKRMGTIIMAIACPVGAVLTFSQWPLLDTFFALLIPSAGAALGVISACFLAGLLFWTHHHKAAKKDGSQAEQVALLNNQLAKVNRLKAELDDIQKNEQLPDADHVLLTQQKNCARLALASILIPVTEVDDNVRADFSRWASTKDILQSYLTATAAFFCAFSGVLGILGAVGAHLPALGVLGIMWGCVPVAGWCSLGIALGVALVGACIYVDKSANSRHERGESRWAVAKKNQTLWKHKEAFMQSFPQSTYASMPSVTTGRLLSTDSYPPQEAVSLPIAPVHNKQLLNPKHQVDPPSVRVSVR